MKASDEALFATKAFLDKNRAAVNIFVEELLRVTREINANPRCVAEERKKLGLLKDLPAKLEAEITPYFEEAVKNGIFPNDGGGEAAAKNDLEFFALSGQLKGENLKVEDFWDLAPLKAASPRWESMTISSKRDASLTLHATSGMSPDVDDG